MRIYINKYLFNLRIYITHLSKYEVLLGFLDDSSWNNFLVGKPKWTSFLINCQPPKFSFGWSKYQNLELSSRKKRWKNHEKKHDENDSNAKKKGYMSTRKSLLSVKTWHKHICKHFPYDLSKKGWVFAFDPLLYAERKVVALESLESGYLFWIFFLFSINFFYN